MNVFDALFTTPLTLLNPVRGANGAYTWSRSPARGVRVIADECNESATGCAVLESGTYYVVSETAPQPGGRLVDGCVTYEIAKVRLFRDLDGRLIAYRCILA